jgi:hypothetical protein
MYKTELKRRVKEGVLQDGCEGWWIDGVFTASWDDVVEFVDAFIKDKLLGGGK